MDTRESSQSIDRAAAEWAARLDRAPLTAQEEDALDAWLQGDIRRQGGLLRAQAILVKASANAGIPLSRHAQLHVLSRPGHGAAPVRKGWMRLGGALAASLLLVGTIALSLVDAPEAYATVKGEIRTLPLPDGSTITLNTETRVKVYDARGRARIKLLHGEMYVQSVADDRQPIIVEVCGKTLQASRAAFGISNLEGASWQVTVREGQVALEGESGSRDIVVASNTRVSMPAPGMHAAPVPAPLTPDEIERLLTWREGRIAFHGETLAEAARSFARYSDTRIVIAEPALADAPVIGLYASNNPVGFARSVATLLDAEVEQSAGQVVIAAKH
ncbi:FecR domain-containing protein [Luteimonas sp. BDR2-5]|uniref:FecR family protein n=1 Tax=Proluteimonas luteida TaxID=2878685 RepID=UPI001E506D27|nr:FecR domain-containing protein [Luteimonas sp. BDR2-5]MCD9027721.1 FecR domain-containing protein [Luteimonas sp. BDR2-5]